MEALKINDSDEIKNEKYYLSKGLKLEVIQYRLRPDDRPPLQIQRDDYNEEIRLIEKEAKQVAKDYKDRIDKIKKKIEPITHGLEVGYMEQEMYVSTCPNDDTHEIEYFDEEGNLVYARAMKPSERTPMKLYSAFKN